MEAHQDICKSGCAIRILPRWNVLDVKIKSIFRNFAKQNKKPHELLQVASCVSEICSIATQNKKPHELLQIAISVMETSNLAKQNKKLQETFYQICQFTKQKKRTHEVLHVASFVSKIRMCSSKKANTHEKYFMRIIDRPQYPNP